MRTAECEWKVGLAGEGEEGGEEGGHAHILTLVMSCNICVREVSVNIFSQSKKFKMTDVIVCVCVCVCEREREKESIVF